MSALGADAWCARQYNHDEPSYQAHWLDAQKKTLGASERREEERVQWREQMKQVDARRLVIVDECGSNIALTPLYARAPKGQRVHDSVPRESSAKIPPCSLPCRSQASEPA